jgi:hypothetical protein
MPYTVGNGDYAGWANWPQVYGSPNAFYFEDNTIQFSSAVSDNSGWSESGDAAQLVVRYNTYDRRNTDITASEPIWDIHGLQSMQSAGGDPNCAYETHDFCDPTRKVCQQYSTMNAEFYGNKIINAPRANPWMGQRGGWMLMFNNAYISPFSDHTIRYAEYSCDSCASDGSYVQHVSNTYVWNNFLNTTLLPLTKGFDVCADRTSDLRIL